MFTCQVLIFYILHLYLLNAVSKRGGGGSLRGLIRLIKTELYYIPNRDLAIERSYTPILQLQLAGI